MADATSLIGRHRTGQFDLFAPLFGEILVPRAVAIEVAPSVPPRPRLRTRPLSAAMPAAIRSANPDNGAREALHSALAIELAAQWVIRDELSARRLAVALGLPVIGTLGMLLPAKRTGLVSAVRPHVEALEGAGFFIAPRLRDQVLATGEAT